METVKMDQMKKNALIIGIILIILSVIVLNLYSAEFKFLSDVLLNYPGMDKIIHFFEYLTLVMVIYLLLYILPLDILKKKRICIAVSSALCISFMDEFYQIYLPGRSFEYADLLINVVGIFTGIIFLYIKKIRLLVTLSLLTVVLSVVSFVTYDSYRKIKHFNLGILSERKKDFEDAMKHYLLAVKSGNESSSLYNQMA